MGRSSPQKRQKRADQRDRREANVYWEYGPAGINLSRTSFLRSDMLSDREADGRKNRGNGMGANSRTQDQMRNLERIRTQIAFFGGSSRRGDDLLWPEQPRDFFARFV